MANWVYNTLTVSRKVWDGIKTPFNAERHAVKDHEGYTFDFNAIVPMPEALSNTVAGSDERWGICAYLSKKYDTTDEKEIYAKEKDLLVSINSFFSEQSVKSALEVVLKDEEKSFDEYVKIGEEYVALYEKYGYCDWYNWAIDNWGTKWNAHDVTIDDTEDEVVYLTFNTAWDPPYPIYEKLAEMYPDEEISGYCEEEADNFMPFEWEVADGSIYSWEVAREDDEEDDDDEEEEVVE